MASRVLSVTAFVTTTAHGPGLGDLERGHWVKSSPAEYPPTIGTKQEPATRNRALCSFLRMNGDQKSDVYAQEKQDFVQHFSQIVRVLTEDEMGHPETGDAIARLKEVLEYNAIGGKYHRGLTVLVACRELVEPRKQDADSLQRALTGLVCGTAASFLPGGR
ncbi:hypothetical protein P7K49_022071 [Saguinus oedipus]|uniref:(2E,6E)-farnesyl diphosphate synthase n=1 Tax=Saguinus oedipus TaxID=9490 RepID=A0ABQ9UUG9_SAGOE|nr:hypothetical protein P7K49_022071 [Saguinus oedipus]